ncbi:MAG: VWA domain-containing protein, partial [Clostridiales bacterium]|nr:VWA domain-containing protein [Clostridiales bacterium]
MKKMSFFAVVLFCFFLSGNAVFSADAGVDVVIAIDCSGSMVNADPEKLVVDCATVLLDQLDKSSARYGAVFFDGEIRTVMPLAEISQQDFIDRIKSELKQNYVRDGNKTDSPRAIARALSMLETNDIGNRQFIVLLTDGNDIPERTVQELETERQYVIERCESLDIPVYTIGLNVDGSMSQDSISEISEKTDAKSYELSSVDELNSVVIGGIYNDFINKMSGASIAQGNFTGAEQEVYVEIPDSYVSLANFNILSAANVNVQVFDQTGTDVTTDANKVLVTKSQSYVTAQLVQPEKGKWKIVFVGETGVKYEIQLIYDYALKVQENIASNTVGNVVLECFLADNAGIVTDTAIYQNVTGAYFNITDASGNMSEYSAAFDGDKYSADIPLPEGDYTFSATIEHKNFTRESVAPVQLKIIPMQATSVPTAVPSLTTIAPSITQVPEQQTEKFPKWLLFALIGGAAAVIVGGAAAVVLIRKGGTVSIAADININIKSATSAASSF